MAYNISKFITVVGGPWNVNLIRRLVCIFGAVGGRRGRHIFVVSRSASPGRYNSNIFVERSRNLDVSWRGWHIFVVGWSASPGRNNSNIFVEHSRNLDVGWRGRRLQVGTTLTFL